MIVEHLKAILSEAGDAMSASLTHLSAELQAIRAGRANPGILDGVRVEAYGSQMPLNQLATVSAPQPDLIVVKPYDKTQLAEIERGIAAANVGLHPTNDGELIRLAVPPLTEERRQELMKQARTKGEEAKVSIRNARHAAKNEIGKLTKEENVPEDMHYEAEERLQKLTDEHTGKVDAVLEKKEKDIMTV